MTKLKLTQSKHQIYLLCFLGRNPVKPTNKVTLVIFKNAPDYYRGKLVPMQLLKTFLQF